MDAMDITSLPSPSVDREGKLIKEEFVGETTDSVSNGDVSFEDLICDMFDKVIQKGETQFGEAMHDIEDVVLLDGEGVIAGDVDLILEMTQANGVSNKEIKDVAVKDIKKEGSYLPLASGDFRIEEEIPIIECELELTSVEQKDKEETKNVIAEVSFENKEKQEEDVDILPSEEHKNVVHLLKNKNETSQKIELREEEKNDDEKFIDNVFVHKPKKMASKKLNISVEDLRSPTVAQVEVEGITTEEGEMGLFDGETSFTDGKNVSESSTSISSRKAEVSESTGSNQFSSVLAEQIKANSAELVQKGKIVLRDGNVGEIRLQLKPAYLGVVRINLKMTGDKKMHGEVTVSSKEAYDAFEDGMDELVSSFKDAGFDTSGFNLNWRGGKEEILREDLRGKYFSPEKTVLSLREKLNVTENIYSYGQAENINVLV